MTFRQLNLGDSFVRDQATWRKCSARHACMVKTNSINKSQIGIPYAFGAELEVVQPEPIGAMNYLRQHLPTFVEGYENETAAFDFLNQMLAIPWVAGFQQMSNFHQFSVSDNYLMAEYRGGREWWVVGFLDNPNIGLPIWDRGIYEVWDNGKEEEIAGDLVSLSCGDDVKLKDGRILKRRSPANVNAS